MTTIAYERRGGRHALRVTGHADPDAGPAGSAAPSQDLFRGEKGNVTGNIVCAAVSVLSCALLRRMADMESAGELLAYAFTQAPGDVRLEARAKAGARERVREAVDTVLTGFRMLEEAYPERVRVVAREGRRGCPPPFTMALTRRKDGE